MNTELERILEEFDELWNTGQLEEDFENFVDENHPSLLSLTDEQMEVEFYRQYIDRKILGFIPEEY
jgi:hypothetical protein